MRRDLVSIAGLALLLALSPAPRRAVADVSSPLTITCPADIIQGNDPGQCGAVVYFQQPVVSGGLPPYLVACSPASGSFLGVGTRTVNCVARDSAAQVVSCSFTVTVKDVEPPTCNLELSGTDSICTTNLVVLPNSPGNTWTPDGNFICDFRHDNCGPYVETFVRSDGVAFFDPQQPLPGSLSYPVGTTVVTDYLADGAGNTASPCSATVTVLDLSLPLASQVSVESHVQAPGGLLHVSGMADLRLQINFPPHPGDPTRIHALIDLHGVTATLNGVDYHATNNVEADLTSNQLSPLSLNVPGSYKFEAHGQAAVHSFSLDMPLQAVVTAGTLSSASFGQPQLVGAVPTGG